MNTLHLACHILQPLFDVVKPKLVSHFNFKSALLQNLVLHHWQRGQTLIFDLSVIKITGYHLIVDVAVQQIPRGKDSVGAVFLIVVIYYFIEVIFISYAGCYSSTVS